MYEDEAWLNCHNDDLWIFDKLVLAKKLGYICGPVGVDVPTPGDYIVRPSVNCMGMGRGAEIVNIQESTDHLPLGYFWCEIFTGRHISVDYKFDIKQRIIEQDLTVEGFRRDGDPIWKFWKWKKINEFVPIHRIILDVKGSYEYINCEYIGDRLVEVHLRNNSDMHESTEVIPVWKSEAIELYGVPKPPEGYVYVEDKDYHRIGFYLKLENGDPVKVIEPQINK